MKKRIALLLALLMLFAMFAACSKSDKTESAKPDAVTNPGTTNSGVIALPDSNAPPSSGNSAETAKVTYKPSADKTLNIASGNAHSGLCTLASGGSTTQIQAHQFFFDTMITFDVESNTIQPSLAESWEWIDEVTLRFHLRKDVKSQLGDPFTANDVQFSFVTGCALTKLGSSYSSIIDIDKCKVVDDYTYDLVLKAQNHFFLYDLSRSAYTFVVEKSVETIGGIEACDFNPACGTGPYKLVEWDQVTNLIKLERNEEYWGQLPYYKYINYFVIADPNTRAMGAEAGDYDVCLNPSTTTAIAGMDSSTFKTLVAPCSTNLIWCFNTNREYYNIKEIRQAICLGINYDAVIQIAYKGYADKCDSWWSIHCPWYSGPEDGEKEFYWYYDPVRAKEKLVEAGYPDGFETEIVFTSGRAYTNDSAQVIVNNLREIGIDMKITNYESATTSDLNKKGDFNIYFSMSTAPTPTMGIKFTDPRKDFLNTNRCGQNWGPENVGEVIDRCTGSESLEKCVEALAEYQDILREYVPCIPFCSPNNFTVVANQVAGVKLDISGSPLLSTFYEDDYIA